MMPVCYSRVVVQFPSVVSVTVLKSFQVSEAWLKCEMWQSGKKESLDKVSPHIVVCL